jgi:energy-coupling factor transport system ATP-binding protein
VTTIALEGLVHVYPDGTRALDGVSLAIPAGQRVAIVGRNGSGKSTLVRHLNGLLRPTDGRILHDGRDILGRRVAQLAAVVGLAFQDPDRQIFAGRVHGGGVQRPEPGAAGGGPRQGVTRRWLPWGSRGGGRQPIRPRLPRRKLLALASILAMETPSSCWTSRPPARMRVAWHACNGSWPS